MDSLLFINKCKELVRDYTNKHTDKSDEVPEFDVFVVWQSKRYQFDERTLNSDDPKVIKEHDDTVDSVKYFCLDNARDLDLRR